MVRKLGSNYSNLTTYKSIANIQDNGKIEPPTGLYSRLTFVTWRSLLSTFSTSSSSTKPQSGNYHAYRQAVCPHILKGGLISQLVRFLGVTPSISTAESTDREKAVTVTLMEELKKQDTFKSEDGARTR